MSEEVKQHVISGCGYKDSCKDLDKAKDGGKREALKEVTNFLEKECKKYANTPIGLMIQGIKERIIQKMLEKELVE